MIDTWAMDEERWRVLGKGIAKAKAILDGYAVNEVFTSAEYITNYDCVYHLCQSTKRSSENQFKLFDEFKRTLEESITFKVYPAVIDKNGVTLVSEVLHLWTNYKVMSKCLRGFFSYLDRRGYERFPSLSDASIRCFHDLVSRVLHQKLIDATILLINQDRNMVSIHQNLLQDFFGFYVESGEHGNGAYQAMFEAILADAATYYSRVASKSIPILSSADYVLLVEKCKLEENTRASKFLHEPYVERLLQAIHSQMLEKYEDKLAEKRTAEDVNSMINQVSSLRVENEV